MSSVQDMKVEQERGNKTSSAGAAAEAAARQNATAATNDEAAAVRGATTAKNDEGKATDGLLSRILNLAGRSLAAVDGRKF